MSEIRARINKLLTIIREEKADAMLVSNAASVRYFSGFTGDSSVLLISPKKNFFITNGIYVEEAERTTEGYKIIRFPKTMLESVGDLLKQIKAKKLIFESHIITYSFFSALKKHTRGINLIPKANAAERVMRYKSPEDIKKIKKSQAITEKSFDTLKKWIKPGLTEKEVALKLQNLMLSNGAERLSFSSIIAADKNSSLPHAQPGSLKIKNNSFITVDCGAIHRWYCSDMTRVIFMGKISPKMKEIYMILREAQEHAFASIKLGVRAKDVDAAARNYIASKGYGQYFGHGLGHGIGMNVHEGPTINPLSTDIIEPGTVFTIEPGIYIPGWGGMRLEDMVYVTDKKIENLTKTEKFSFSK